MVIKKLLLLSCFLLGEILVGQNSNTSFQIKIKNGSIEGFQDANAGLDKFFGIPFAQPPVGELRWKAPQPLKNWQGVKETKKFGPMPVQANVFGDMVFRAPKQSEDCLYLNVWAPTGKEDQKLPVLVYFYGGGYVAGDGSEPRYDGSSLAKKGIVVVTVNYRLNIFGFFAYPELSAEAPSHASGNYGLLDQNMALKWVKQNISAFGGDPSRVTIGGESAGSISVSAQMASPLSKDLIAGAMGESGAAIKPTLAPVPLAEAEKAGQEFAEKAGYYSLKELRALSTDELFDVYKKSGRFGFPLVIDGYFLPKSLPEIFRDGKQAKVPLLLGWNSAESGGEGFMENLPYSKENYLTKVKEVYPKDFEKVLNLYPASSEKEIEISATALASDRFIVYSTWKWFDLQRKNTEAPVYRYLFSRIRPALKDGKQTNGARHATEIEYFLGNLDRNKVYNWSSEDYKTSEMIQEYLANFIKTGNPNSKNLTDWPAVNPQETSTKVMVLDSIPHVKEAKHDDRYRFLDKAYENTAEE